MILRKFLKQFTTVLSIILITSTTNAQELNLSGSGWKAWLDKDAEWKNDTLYLPYELQESLQELPLNIPTGGWEVLENTGKDVSVPMTMDEYFLDGINTNTYEGVSWIWRTIEVPKDFKNKIVFLKVEKARMRAEVFINNKLAAYDIVGETPFDFDVSEFVKPGKENFIAIRLTNPGGHRGWGDWGLKWGDYSFNSNGHNFTTLGNLSLEAKPEIYCKSVFIKNVLPAKAKNVEVFIEVENTTDQSIEASLPIMISDKLSSADISGKTLNETLKPGTNLIKTNFTLEKAELWSPENPKLYSCKIQVNADKVKDELTETFGVRTFEVLKGKSGGHNYYLNGERFFYSTSIDWGYYTPHGDYATQELAEKSIRAAKAMNLNGLTFHRKIGEPLVLKYADELGLCMYEEPGGFHKVDTVGFSANHIKEKIRRMVLRDRNHPSLIIYNLSNEDHNYNSLRKECLEMVNELDDSRLITNSSGIEPTPTPHIRPYEKEIRTDFRDQHTAGNQGAIYEDKDFYQKIHRNESYEDCIYFLGEVNSTTGPDNWHKTYRSMSADTNSYKGYDLNIYKENHDKIEKAFKEWNLAEIGSGNIKSPEDVSVQAGRGMMYIHGRHAQSIMCNNDAEGLALNGWTPGPQSEGNGLDWASGILDEGRNLKGPVETYTYWVESLQIAMARKNGKYFNVGDTVIFEVNLVNQDKIEKGNYTLSFTVTDGAGNTQTLENKYTVNVEGGERFAQKLKDLEFITKDNWSAGYLTVHATLNKGKNVVAEGKEQVLLQNRESVYAGLKDIAFEVRQWPGAREALEATGNIVNLGQEKEVKDSIKDATKHRVILCGGLTDTEMFPSAENTVRNWWDVDRILNQVKKGEILILKFDKYWAQALKYKGVLSADVTEWGGDQTFHWYGNGWGYIDHFAGYESLGNKGTIGTNAWEVTDDPYGFYPFESDYKLSVYGMYLCRPWLCKVPPIASRMLEQEPTMAVTLGVIEYGKGKIILNPCYQVDENKAFTDMLFYNMITKATKGEW